MSTDNPNFDETGVLHAALWAPELMGDVDWLEAGDFLNSDHGAIWGELRAMRNAGEPIDATTLVRRLMARGDFERLQPAFADMLHTGGDPAHLGYWAERVKRRALSDRLEDAEGVDQHETAVRCLRDFEQKAAGAHATHDGRQVALAMLDKIEENRRIRESGELPGIPTGFAKMDRNTGGWRPSRLAVIGGRPGMGKSVLLLQHAQASAMNGVSTMFLSMEMPAEECGIRIAAAQTGIDSKRIEAGDMTKGEHLALERHLQAQMNRPLQIETFDSATVGQLEARIERAAADGYRLVCLDYLQMVSGSGMESRRIEIEACAAMLKRQALRHQIAVIAAAQLNRDTENRRPGLRDFQESSKIEQSADYCVLIHYDRPESEDTELPDPEGFLIFEKFRSGAPFAVPTRLELPFNRFTEI